MKTQQRGFNIVELMVALTIGLFLIGGAITLFLSSKQSYRVQQEHARLQENGRFAMNLLTRDIRMAGYFGCASSAATLNNHLNGHDNGSLFDTTYAIEGLNNYSAENQWQPSQTATDVDLSYDNTNSRHPDAITVRHLSAKSSRLNNRMVDLNASLGLTLDANDSRTPEITHKTIVGISNCAATDLFQVSNQPNFGATILQHHRGGGSDAANRNETLSIQYDVKTDQNEAATIAPYVANRYYIGEGKSGPALYRQTYSPDPPEESPPSVIYTSAEGTVYAEEIISGVENMQITYGVDLNNDGAPDQYLDADAVAPGAQKINWNQLTSVRVGLLLASHKPSQDTPGDKIFDVNGTRVCAQGSTVQCDQYYPQDKHQRQVVSNTIFLRNHRTQ